MELSRVVDEPHCPYAHVLPFLGYKVEQGIRESDKPAQGIQTAINFVF